MTMKDEGGFLVPDSLVPMVMDFAKNGGSISAYSEYDPRTQGLRFLYTQSFSEHTQTFYWYCST